MTTETNSRIRRTMYIVNVGVFVVHPTVFITLLILSFFAQPPTIVEFTIAGFVLAGVIYLIAWYQYEPEERVPLTELAPILAKWLLPASSVWFLLAGLGLANVFLADNSHYPLLQRIACCGFLLLSLTTLIGWVRYLARSRTLEPGSEST